MYGDKCFCGNDAPVWGIFDWGDDGQTRSHNGGICLNCALHGVRARNVGAQRWGVSLCWVAKWRQTWVPARVHKPDPFKMTVGERGVW